MVYWAMSSKTTLSPTLRGLGNEIRPYHITGQAGEPSQPVRYAATPQALWPLLLPVDRASQAHRAYGLRPRVSKTAIAGSRFRTSKTVAINTPASYTTASPGSKHDIYVELFFESCDHLAQEV